MGTIKIPEPSSSRRPNNNRSTPAPKKQVKNMSRKEVNQEYVEYRNKFIHVSELEDKSVTPDDLKKMDKTTYIRTQIPPKLTDEALIQTAENYIMQCSKSGYPFITYEEALIHTIVPELLKRLKENTKLVKRS